MRVLLVGVDPMVARFTERILVEVGYVVERGGDGEEHVSLFAPIFP